VERSPNWSILGVVACVKDSGAGIKIRCPPTSTIAADAAPEQAISDKQMKFLIRVRTFVYICFAFFRGMSEIVG